MRRGDRGAGKRGRAAKIDATRHKSSLRQCRLKQRNEKRKQHEKNLTGQKKRKQENKMLCQELYLYAAHSPCKLEKREV